LRDWLAAHHPPGSAARELMKALDLPVPHPRVSGVTAESTPGRLTAILGGEHHVVAGDEPPGPQGIDNLDGPGGWSGARYVESPSAAAAAAYQEIRIADDVGSISTNTGLPADVVSQVKHHLFIGEHDIPLAAGRTQLGNFTPDTDIANLWRRSAAGTLTPDEQVSFRSLVAHEYVESRLMESGMPYRSSHPDAWSADGSALFNPQHFGAHDVAPKSSNGSLAHWNRLGLVAPEESLRPDLSNIDDILSSALRQLGSGK
jgi:hypothetical protein